MIPSDIRRCVGVPFRAQTVTSLSHRTSPRAHLTSAMHLRGYASRIWLWCYVIAAPWRLSWSASFRSQQKETQKPHTTTSQCIHSFLFLPHKKSTCRVSFEVETNRSTVPSLRSLALRGPTKSAKFGMLECWRRWWYNTTGRFYVVLHLIRSTLNSKTKYSSSACLLSLVLSKKRQLLLTRFCSTWRS